MDKSKCSFCGSQKVSKKTEERVAEVPGGFSSMYSVALVECAACGFIDSSSQENQDAFNVAYKNAENASFESIYKQLSGSGFSAAYIERALHLPQRTLARWKGQNRSAAGMTLMNLVAACPWLIKVADHNYDRSVVVKEVVHQAADFFSLMAQSPNHSTTVLMQADVNSLSLFAHVSRNSSSMIEEPSNLISVSQSDEVRKIA